MIFIFAFLIITLKYAFNSYMLYLCTGEYAPIEGIFTAGNIIFLMVCFLLDVALSRNENNK